MAKKGEKLSLEYRKKISISLMGNKNSIGCTPWNKGISWITPEHKEKIRSASSGEKNIMWRGDNVGYDALHNWVVRKLGKPMSCTVCGIKNLKTIQYQWANISGKYKRDLNDWKRMCSKCHKLYDKAWLKRKRNKHGQFQ